MKSLRVNLTFNSDTSDKLVKYVSDMSPRSRGEYLRKVATIGHHILMQSNSLSLNPPVSLPENTGQVDNDDEQMAQDFSKLINTDY